MREAFANDPGETWARNGEICPRTTNGNGNTPIPLDGLANLTFDKFTNRITTAGFEYDPAGNQRRIVKANGAAQKFQYDAANRLVTVYDDSATLGKVSPTGDEPASVVQDGDVNSNYRTYYAGNWAEYIETPSVLPCRSGARRYRATGVTTPRLQSDHLRVAGAKKRTFLCATRQSVELAPNPPTFRVKPYH